MDCVLGGELGCILLLLADELLHDIVIMRHLVGILTGTYSARGRSQLISIEQKRHLVVPTCLWKAALRRKSAVHGSQ
jgi:hypothetical protein